MENYNRVDKNLDRIFYFLNNELHRINGPAVEYRNGYKEWWQNGKYHRIDGPAIENRNVEKYWHYEGKYIKCKSQKEFERLIKLKLFW